MINHTKDIPSSHRTQNHGMRFSKRDYETLQEIAFDCDLTVSQLVNQQMGRLALEQGYKWEGLQRRGSNQFLVKNSEPPKNGG